jgi:predicted secreted protein
VIQLDEVPTSGYRWEVGNFDPAVLEFLRDDFVPSGGARIGGGGQREFCFRAVGPGRSPVRLIHRRPWESESESVEELNATIEVAE